MIQLPPPSRPRRSEFFFFMKPEPRRPVAFPPETRRESRRRGAKDQRSFWRVDSRGRRVTLLRGGGHPAGRNQETLASSPANGVLTKALDDFSAALTGMRSF